MPEEFKPGCVRPKAKPVGDKPVSTGPDEQTIKKEERKPMIQVGKKAPDFSAPAYLQGKFVNINLSEYSGKWTLLCFYPGDFTFV